MPTGRTPKCDPIGVACVEVWGEVVSASCGVTYCTAVFRGHASGYGNMVRPEPALPPTSGRTYVNGAGGYGECHWLTPLGCETSADFVARYYLRGETACRTITGVAKAPTGQAVSKITLCVKF